MPKFIGEKYKVLGFEVEQKGTLVSVFARFSRVEQTYEELLEDKKECDKQEAAYREAEQNGTLPKPDEGKTLGEVMSALPKISELSTLPSLSTDDIYKAIVGPKNFGAKGDLEHLRLFSITKDEIFEDFGPEKLAELLIEMGKIRKDTYKKGTSSFKVL